MVRLGGDTSTTFFWTVQVQEPLKQRKHPLREIFKITLEKQTAPLQKIVDHRIQPPTATPASPELRRSKRTPKPPQRLIEELWANIVMQFWTLLKDI